VHDLLAGVAVHVVPDRLYRELVLLGVGVDDLEAGELEGVDRPLLPVGPVVRHRVGEVDGLSAHSPMLLMRWPAATAPNHIATHATTDMPSASARPTQSGHLPSGLISSDELVGPNDETLTCKERTPVNCPAATRQHLKHNGVRHLKARHQ